MALGRKVSLPRDVYLLIVPDWSWQRIARIETKERFPSLRASQGGQLNDTLAAVRYINARQKGPIMEWSGARGDTLPDDIDTMPRTQLPEVSASTLKS